MIRKILVGKGIEISKELDDLIDQIFEHGGSSRMQINDVLEWIDGSPENTASLGLVLAEAEKLLATHGEFYIEKSSD